MESELFGHARGAFSGAVASATTAQLLAARGRHGVPRRDRRHAAVDAGEAPARARGPGGQPPRRDAWHESTSASSPPPTATCARSIEAGHVRRRPLRAAGDRPHPSRRRCASGGGYAGWRGHFIARFARDQAAGGHRHRARGAARRCTPTLAGQHPRAAQRGLPGAGLQARRAPSCCSRTCRGAFCAAACGGAARGAVGSRGDRAQSSAAR